MGTNNFADIAKFVAKSAYIYVVCNTYIQRVYIKMLAIPARANIAVVSISPRLRMRCNSGIGKHESNFMKKKTGPSFFIFMNQIS